MSNFKKVIESTKSQGVVSYEQQSPEQREEFIGRVKCLNAVNINLGLVQDNWNFIAAAIPDKTVDRKLHQQYKQIVSSLQDTLIASKMLNARLMNLLVVNNDAKERVETFSWYNKEIISKLLKIPHDRIELALKVVDGLGSNDPIQAETPEEYAQNMVDFANYCMNLQGRKKATKRDLEKFLNKK